MTPSEKDRALLAHLRKARLEGSRHDGGATPAGPREAGTADAASVREIGGRRKGLDPTRYGDWEKDGRCIDF